MRRSINILEWNLKFKETKDRDIVIDVGLDDFKILKKSKNETCYEFYIKINKSTPIFELNASYIVRFHKEKKEKFLSMKHMTDFMRFAISIESNSLLSVCLKYSGQLPPFPLLFETTGPPPDDKVKSKAKKKD